MSHKYRLHWIDYLRGIAILAVVSDHALFLFPNPILVVYQKYLFFSVTWFAFLAGVSNTLSASKRVFSPPKSYIFFWKKRLPTVIIFIFASLVVSIIQPGGINQTPIQVIRGITQFKASPPYYYFAVLFWLYALFPLLYNLSLYMKSIISKIILTIIIFAFGWFVYLNSGFWHWGLENILFAGPYLGVFMLGIIYVKLSRKQKLILESIFSLSFIYLFINYHFYKISIFSLTPSLKLLFWSIGLMFIFKWIFELFSDNKLDNRKWHNRDSRLRFFKLSKVN